MSQLASSSSSQLDSWTIWSISVFALPSVIHNDPSFLLLVYSGNFRHRLCSNTGFCTSHCFGPSPENYLHKLSLLLRGYPASVFFWNVVQLCAVALNWQEPSCAKVTGSILLVPVALAVVKAPDSFHLNLVHQMILVICCRNFSPL